MYRKLLLAAVLALLPSIATAKIGGDVDKIPTIPSAYTIVCVPQHSDMQAFASDPELVALRQSTDFTVYTPNDPDFKHRWADRLPQIRDGKSKFALIVEQDGKKLFGAAGDTLTDVCSAAKADGVVSRLNSSNGCRPFCPNCPQRRPKEEPEQREPEHREPLRQILPPLIERETTKIVERQAESDPLGLIGLVFAGMVPACLLCGVGSYFITRNIDENQDQE